MARRAESHRRPWQLPIVHWSGADYFVDGRLRQFRQVDNPHNFIDFGTEIGEQMCDECHVMRCPHCEQDELMYTDDDGQSWECSRCGYRFWGQSEVV